MSEKLDIKDIRRMNLIGTTFFGLFGLISVANIFFDIIRIIKHYPKGFTYDYSSDLKFAIILLCIIIIFTILLYRYTVIALDRGNYKAVKFFTLIGIIIGWIGLILPSIAFFKSYRSLDDVIDDNKKSASNQ